MKKINNCKYIIILGFILIAFVIVLSVNKVIIETEVFGQSNSNTKTQTNQNLDENNEMLGVGVDGGLIKAFQIAFDDFKMESKIESEKKQIVNYTIGLSYGIGYYKIQFSPKRKADEKPVFGGSTSLGKFVVYKIDNQFQIIEKKFIR